MYVWSHFPTGQFWSHLTVALSSGHNFEVWQTPDAGFCLLGAVRALFVPPVQRVCRWEGFLRPGDPKMQPVSVILKPGSLGPIWPPSQCPKPGTFNCLYIFFAPINRLVKVNFYVSWQSKFPWLFPCWWMTQGFCMLVTSHWHSSETGREVMRQQSSLRPRLAKLSKVLLPFSLSLVSSGSQSFWHVCYSRKMRLLIKKNIENWE